LLVNIDMSVAMPVRWGKVGFLLLKRMMPAKLGTATAFNGLC